MSVTASYSTAQLLHRPLIPTGQSIKLERAKASWPRCERTTPQESAAQTWSSSAKGLFRRSSMCKGSPTAEVTRRCSIEKQDSKRYAVLRISPAALAQLMTRSAQPVVNSECCSCRTVRGFGAGDGVDRSDSKYFSDYTAFNAKCMAQQTNCAMHFALNAV